MMTKKRLDELRNHDDHDVIYNEDLSELVAEVERLRAEVERLKEFEWMYKDLCK